MIALEDFLGKNPDRGDIIKGTGGVRKLRWTLPKKGKSGGTGVLYIDFLSYEKLYLLDLYSKGEKEEITEKEKKELKRLVKAIADNLRKGV